MHKDILFNDVGSLFLRPKNWYQDAAEEFLFYLQSMKAVKWICIVHD